MYTLLYTILHYTILHYNYSYILWQHIWFSISINLWIYQNRHIDDNHTQSWHLLTHNWAITPSPSQKSSCNWMIGGWMWHVWKLINLVACGYESKFYNLSPWTSSDVKHLRQEPKVFLFKEWYRCSTPAVVVLPAVLFLWDH